MTVKLSELIRKGAALYPEQAQGSYVEWHENNAPAICALGAAYVGGGYDVITLDGGGPNPDDLLETLGVDPMTEISFPPECSLIGERQLWSIIPYLNDTLRWSHNHIADYLEEQGL